MKLKDKRGRGFGFMAYLTKGLIMGIIFFILFAIWGGSGGFSLVNKIGDLMSQIPAWVYLILGGVWLLGRSFGK